MATPTFLDHLVTFVLGLGMPLTAIVGAKRKGKKPIAWDAPTRITTMWANGVFLLLLGGAVLYTWHRAGRPLKDLGLTPLSRSFPPVGLGLGLLILALYALDIWAKMRDEDGRAEARRRWRLNTPFMPLRLAEVPHSILLCAGAAIGEELLFRGHLISYLQHYLPPGLLGDAIAVTAPAAIFALSHAYQGMGAILRILLGAVLFGAIYVISGSLWIPIVVHFLVDLSGSFAGPILFPAGTLDGQPES